VRLTLKRLTICDCGESVLDESIPLGTEYDWSGPAVQVTYICGRCKHRQDISGVYVRRVGARNGGIVPYDLFQEPSKPDAAV
jgi:hypothetical protein